MELKKYQKYLTQHPDKLNKGKQIVQREYRVSDSYRKWIINEDGTIETTTAPMEVLLGTDRWQVWKVEDIHVAHNTRCPTRNRWWDYLIALYPGMPCFYGPMVIFEWGFECSHTMAHIESVLARYCARKLSEAFSFDEEVTEQHEGGKVKTKFNKCVKRKRK